MFDLCSLQTFIFESFSSVSCVHPGTPFFFLDKSVGEETKDVYEELGRTVPP